MVKVLISLSVLTAVAMAGSVTELPESVTKLIDYSINPCDHYYQYSCGMWHKDDVLPPDVYHIDTSFNKLDIQNEVVLTKIFSDNKTKLRKFGEFYNSCLDTATLSSLGLTPLEDSFKAIRSASTKLDLLIVAAKLAKNGIPAFVEVNAGVEFLHVCIPRSKTLKSQLAATKNIGQLFDCPDLPVKLRQDLRVLTRHQRVVINKLRAQIPESEELRRPQRYPRDHRLIDPPERSNRRTE
ncbi:hypothetical protein H257_11921 [Aphanomyces astaci]|uniref:Peptidase M13 N-terminal domain-containing protein n=1 Tax=Aphanomyces astaci TaxID=112090 RepID=W4G076_APHAT|nr:hypothetical protein H257_11921 [Aphanomyces astaci]ETV73097.1 hypothetical protein H257_11921 [Aphanomyces astaci]|eukprot:XP_009837302.1 hypothetical protein H257_11921 [Aphanomyces astaci]